MKRSLKDQGGLGVVISSAIVFNIIGSLSEETSRIRDASVDLSGPDMPKDRHQVSRRHPVRNEEFHFGLDHHCSTVQT